MVWQRLFGVGLYAVALTSVGYEASAIEVSPPGVDAKPAAAKKHGARGKAVKARHHADMKVATVKSEVWRVSSAEAANLLHPHERKAGQVGYASWYGAERNGKLTASGRRFDKTELTAAHRTLPLHSKVQVTNMANGRSVTVRITDRGPSRQGRIIDLSQSAAEQIGMRHAGVARVAVEPVLAGNFQ
jgi:peptidoglycan lytic transglycosylase